MTAIAIILAALILEHGITKAIDRLTAAIIKSIQSQENHHG